MLKQMILNPKMKQYKRGKKEFPNLNGMKFNQFFMIDVAEQSGCTVSDHRVDVIM